MPLHTRSALRIVVTVGCLSIAACTTPATQVPIKSAETARDAQTNPLVTPRAARPGEPKVLDGDAADRLLHNTGITLQWIGTKQRGTATVAVDPFGAWTLQARQGGKDGEELQVFGQITEIGTDYFLLDGRIMISNTPDRGRQCARSSDSDGWRFAITQNRKYWRLREFEWCDGLTDYIDIYF